MVGMYLFINSYARGMKVPAVIMCNECNFPGKDAYGEEIRR